MNTKQFGNIGIGKAINFFLSKGYVVSLPINDSQSYDLVVEIDNKLCKIQVKMSGQKKENGIFIIDLRSTGGNQSRNTIKHFDKNSCDYVFACTSENETYLIPSEECNKHSISLGDKYKNFIL
jgi:hypothetical protein